jgi:hypothetical protein
VLVRRVPADLHVTGPGAEAEARIGDVAGNGATLGAPSFLIIGAQKSATTWLHQMLDAHPDVWMPREKELHYFDEKLWKPGVELRSYLRGDRLEDQRWRRQVRHQIRLYRTQPTLDGVIWNLRYFLGRRSDDWYARLFKQGAGRVTGEATPNYSILARERVEHIAAVLPDVRVILIVRHPIERAWSHAVMERIRRQPRPPTADELRDHFTSERSRRLTDYPLMIETWGSAIPADQFLLAWLEDVHFRPKEFLGRVCELLGLPEPPQWPSGLEQPVWKGPLQTLPYEHAAFLADLYSEQIDEFASRFGGHADWWRYAADNLDQVASDGGELGYPFYDSRLWPLYLEREDREPSWIPPLQSATLAQTGYVAQRQVD